MVTGATGRVGMALEHLPRSRTLVCRKADNLHTLNLVAFLATFLLMYVKAMTCED